MGALTKCPLCNGSIVEHWLTVNIWKCNECRLLIRNPMPTQAELDDLYQNSWKGPLENLEETGGTSPRLASIYARKLADSLGYEDFSGMKILEFGSGKGEMLRALSELGAETYGVEPFGHEYLQKQGYYSFPSLDDIPIDIVFDGVFSIDVIEHLHAPLQKINQMTKQLKNNGFIFLSTANTNSLNSKIKGDQWREVLKTGHLVLFNDQSMKKLLENSGLNRYQRLNWFVPYSKELARNLVHFALQSLHIDGELRYLAWKA